ncbi:hypothetical protein KJ641_00385 [Patescibacteria group bacterium]|nr:hypothetical protein [Patescibacteria group bacterium]MBU1895316.1 hypothetical protein [Patescibacteria group bacterium]
MIDEEEWALDLQKDRQTRTQNPDVPFDVQRNNLKEELDYYKNKLKQSCHEKSKTAIKENLEKLIYLRGKSTALTLGQIKDMYGELSDSTISYYSKKYQDDCFELLKITKELCK